MGIADDIQEVFQEVGVLYEIIRKSGNISGEYLDWEPNTQVTKPFVREFFLEVSLADQTEVIGGDVIQFMPSGEDGGVKYLVMNKTKDIFENEGVKWDGVLYKCNVSGELSRPSGEAYDQNYDKRLIFSPIESEAYALQTEPLFGSELEDTEMGALGIENHELYIPTRFGAREHDRYITVSGEEYYMITSVKKRRYQGVDVCTLSEDTR